MQLSQARRPWWGKKSRDRLLKVIGLVLLLPGLAWVLMPVLWMISAAFSTLQQVMRVPPELIPSPWVWTNFAKGFASIHFGRYYLNSLLIAGLRIATQIGLFSITGYAFARLRAPGRDVLFMVILSTLMLPYTVVMIPQFVMFKSWGWVNTYYPLFVPHLGFGAFLIFLFRQFFRSIPDELFDAARLDGCSHLGTYWWICLPLSKPALMTACILIVQTAWQDLIGPLIYLNYERLYTIPLGLANMRNTLGASPWNLIMALSLVAALPPILLFFFGQQHLISGIVVTEK